MKQISRLLISLSSLMISAFCLFGFLATFEPVQNAMIFRGVYVILGLTTAIVSTRMMYLAVRNP